MDIYAITKKHKITKDISFIAYCQTQKQVKNIVQYFIDTEHSHENIYTYDYIKLFQLSINKECEKIYEMSIIYIIHKEDKKTKKNIAVGYYLQQIEALKMMEQLNKYDIDYNFTFEKQYININ